MQNVVSNVIFISLPHLLPFLLNCRAKHFPCSLEKDNLIIYPCLVLVPTLHRVAGKSGRKPDDLFFLGERDEHAEEGREKEAKEKLS